MKTNKIIVALFAALFGITSFTAKVSASVNVIPVDIPDRTIVQVTSPANTTASIYVYDSEGTVLHSDLISPEASIKVYDFSDLRDGIYTFESRSELMNITRKIGVEDSKVEILSKETEFKPYFSIEENELKVNFLNQDQKDVEFSIENALGVYYQGLEGDKTNFSKKYDISNLWLGYYYAKLKVGGKTYYHYFNVN
jgi:hypothetical protein